jgi:hypothetical protein
LILNAQNSKEEYDKAVDYCACKIAYVYSADYATKNPNSDEKKSFDEVISKQLKDCDKQNISISDLEKLLKENNFNSFSEILLPEVKKAKNSYPNNSNKEEAINNILISFKLSLDKIDIKGELGNDLDDKIQNFKNQNNTVEENKSVGTTDPISTKKNNYSDRMINENRGTAEKSFFPNWLLFVLILICSALLVLNNYFKSKNLKDSIKRHREEIEELKKNRVSLYLFEENTKKNLSFKKDIDQNIIDLNFAIQKLQKDNSYNQTFQQKEISQTPPRPKNIASHPKEILKTNDITENNKKEIKKVMYGKTPISDKTFNALDISEDKEGKFYKFIMFDYDQAEFEFFNTDNSAKRAVNSPDSFLYPVCEEFESLNQNAKKIITKKPGIVTKQDDKWIVKEKALIAYE